MVRSFALLLLSALLPLGVYAATLEADDSVAVSTSPLGNAYFAGAEVVINAPLPEDLLAVAGTIRVLERISGDVLLAAGSIGITAPIEGDIRALGGQIEVSSDVEGDIAVLGGTVRVSGTAREIEAAGGRIELTGGSEGSVTVYGGSVHLSGEFLGDVRVVSSERVTLGEGTIIDGVFEYNAPVETTIPSSVDVRGGVRYVGSSTFLPTAEEAQTFALAGLGVLFVVRLVAAALAGALIVGLFPSFSQGVVLTIVDKKVGRVSKLFLLGLLVLFGTPVLLVLLLASFVGIGIATLIGAFYILLLLLSYIYAGALLGALSMRIILKQPLVSWQSALLGMLLLYVIGLIPVIGLLTTFVLSAVSLGALVLVMYRFSFKRESLLS